MNIYEILAYSVVGLLVIEFTYVFGSMYLQLKKDKPIKGGK